MKQTDDLAVTGQRAVAATAVASWFANVPDLDPDWAQRNPERAMAWLFVTPRPCQALDRLLGL
ncbi:MAG: hypothetical protein NVS3B5_10600 [Sphingomicrobium sp.]